MHDKATYWLLRQRRGDMSVDAWEAFADWLEADPRHVDVYDALVDADEALDDLGSVSGENTASDMSPAADLPAPANDNPLTRFIPWIMATAAAAVLAIFVFPLGGPGGSGVTAIATAPGEIRTVAISDTITMTLNGSSAVEMQNGAPNVRVERGEVAFAINSPTPSALRVAADSLVLTDIGTEFSVILNDDSVRVAVADGIVAVNPEDENIEVPAGEAVEKPIGSETLIRTEIDPEIVASWREGRLEFDDTPIAGALAQVERSSGVTITTAARFAKARLTGSVVIDAAPGVIARRFADVVGGTARRDGEVWTID